MIKNNYADLHFICNDCKTEFKQTLHSHTEEYDYLSTQSSLGETIKLHCPNCNKWIFSTIEQVNYEFIN